MDRRYSKMPEGVSLLHNTGTKTEEWRRQIAALTIQLAFRQVHKHLLHIDSSHFYQLPLFTESFGYCGLFVYSFTYLNFIPGFDSPFDLDLFPIL